MPEKEDGASQKNGKVAQVNRAAASSLPGQRGRQRGKARRAVGGLHERSETPALPLDSEKDTGEAPGRKGCTPFPPGCLF